MDLLDLELDLGVEGASTPPRVTRRSQANKPAETFSTPASSKKSVTSTLKKGASTSKTPTKTRRDADTSSNQRNETAKTSATSGSSKKESTSETPVSKKTKSTISTSSEPTSDDSTPRRTVQRTDTRESLSREESSNRSSRSPSTEKRSRNKAKKRFSPSPDAPNSKKRKTMLQTPATTERKTVRIATTAEFTEHMNTISQFLQERGPVDFDIPEIWKSVTPSETVDEIMKIHSSKANNKKRVIDDKSTRKTTADDTKTPKEKTPNKTKASSVHSRSHEEMKNKKSKPQKMSSKPDEPSSSERCRTFSRELGLDDERSSAEPAPISKPQRKSVSAKTPKEEESKETKPSRKSVVQAPIKEHVERAEEKEAVIKEESGESQSAKKDEKAISNRPGRRRSGAVSIGEKKDEGEKSMETPAKKPKKSISKKTSKGEIDVSEEPSISTQPGSSTEELSTPTPLNPNSALAIKERLTKYSPIQKGKKLKDATPKKDKPSTIAQKEEEPKADSNSTPVDTMSTEVKPEEKVVSEDIVTPTAPITPTPKKSAPVVVAPPTRASARVSKPNRLYADESFNTEIIGRTRVSEQNPVKEAQAKEESAAPEVSLPSTSSLSNSRRKSTATPRPPPTPKPVPIINGVFRGYVQSVKMPIPDVEVDGVVYKLNDDVIHTMNVLMLKVCEDGVEFHEDIDPRVVRAKNKAKVDHVKRLKQEARKLDIQMNVASSSEDLGKRKRQAPRTDDFYWASTANRLKLKIVTKEGEREETPPEDIEVLRPDERQQQKARDTISHMFDAEMDAAMKDAKKYSVSFDKYIRPRIENSQKRAQIKLMSRKRQSTEPDDFYYHELLVDQPSPSNSNSENVEEDQVDVLDTEEDEQVVSQESAISIRTEALDIAEQITALVARPTQADGSENLLDEIITRALEHVESRKACLEGAVDVLRNQLAHELAAPSGDAEQQGCMWHTVTSASAQQLKNVYIVSNTSRENVILWTHRFLLENLPVHILASYLSVLRYMRRIFKIQSPTTFSFIICSTDLIDETWSQVTDIVKTFVYKRGTEPGTDVLSSTIPYSRMADTVFLLVSPTLTFGDHANHSRPRHHGRIFRWLQSIGHQDSECISFNENIDSGCSVAEYLSDILIEKICDSVKHKVKTRPNCKIVLVGYGSTTYLAHRAANLVGGIWAIISIGFPVMTPLGRRGTADDEILLTYCPTLFIVGADGQRFNNEAMSELRSSMIAPTGLVIVGHSSDLLQVPTSILLRTGISQTVVYRMILEKILDFLNLDDVRNQDPANLVPIELNNIYELDPALLKSDKALSGLAFATSSASSSAAPSPVGGSGRRATVTGVTSDDMPKRKRETHQHSAHGLPLPSPRNDEKYLAFQNLVTSSVATIDDMPRRASMGASPRVVERGDFRDHRPSALPTVPTRPPISNSLLQTVKGPIDPASISLN